VFDGQDNGGLDAIIVRGAREHNLKNLTVAIPRGRLVVITGVSGSGKSTLAFDLLFAEGQRRFLDSMNTYARHFIEQMTRPDVDLIAGIPPTVSIEQRIARGGGKSTVATVTEVYHFIRLLFARLGTLFCPDCQIPVEAQTPEEVCRRLEREVRRRGPLRLLAPVVRHRKGIHSDVALWAARQGFEQIRADGVIRPSREPLRLARYNEHNIEVVVGSVSHSRGRDAARRLRELVARALDVGRGTLLALDERDGLSVHSSVRACPRCERSFEPLDPKHFSFNSAQGWCPKCRGFGELFYLPDVERGARADAIEESWYEWMEGKRELCPECHGSRLNPVARSVRLLPESGIRLPSRWPEPPTVETIARMSVGEAREFFAGMKFSGLAAAVARDVMPEIKARLRFMEEVGLGYLQLGRGVPTLSGGEAQRIRLAAQLGSNLAGVLYVLDEPTIGLHARDNERLLAALELLKRRGNSLVVVEHDEATMRRADYIIDLGPGAGVRGGEVVAAGTLSQLMRHASSITGQCLRQPKKYPLRGKRRPTALPGSNSPGDARWLILEGARRHNLKNLTVHFPLNRLVLVTGISGSGKSTLVRECLMPALRARLKGGQGAPPPPDAGHIVDGHQWIRAVYEVDQSPIGRTPRSVPATYVGFLDDIRALYAQVPEARMRGYGPGRFSFNSPQGRCPECDGAGVVKLEMSFLPPALVKCEVCQGQRFNRETLDILYQGRNIAQTLELSVAEAREAFAFHPRIRRALDALHDTGLDYLKLGQPSPTLSGGEAQRLKLVTHLLTGFTDGGRARGWKSDIDERRPGALFVLEEPTIGLHIADVRRLVEVLHRLIDAGHSVLVIEHNLDLIAEADWVIDLGPEGGDGGGQLVAQGAPEQIAANKNSHTGAFLRKILKKTGP